MHLKQDSKMEEGLTVFLPDLFMEVRPPATIKQPPMREGNPSAGREKIINNAASIQS